MSPATQTAEWVASDVATHYAVADGVSIAYQVHGDGPIDIVFVPGFVSHVDLFWEEPHAARLLRRLTSFSRLIVYDKRGQGLSDRTGRPPTLEDSMGDLKAVMEAADCRPAVVFGISEGGPMSALFAATHPDLVASLVLYGTYARALAAPDHPAGVPTEALDGFLEMVTQEWGGPVASGIWAPSLDGYPEFERWWARLLRQGTSPAGALALFDLYREIDVRPILPTIQVPTLVLHRGGDLVVPVGQGRYLAEQIPDARYVELSDSDHLVTTGDQDALVDEVEEFLVGSRRAHEPERALATVLFTDIVSSTERTGELGDRRWRHLLERHNTVVRRQLAIHRGGEVKTLGDGFLATFDGPARAIRCATAIRDDLQRIGVDVRAGVHTGEVELIDDDVSGMAVNIGARIGALAKPGEVCVSSTVRELVVGSGLEFAERGVHDLKGAPGAWCLYAVEQ
jgi:pimeloyl-ACP methyl ester carboxylesterase